MLSGVFNGACYVRGIFLMKTRCYCVGLHVKNALPFSKIPSTKNIPVLSLMSKFFIHRIPWKLHRYLQQKHAKLGPIFRDVLSGCEFVIVSDPNDLITVFQNEGKQPNNFIPEAWLEHIKDSGAKRGVFFMQGQEWEDTRKLLNKRFLKPNVMRSYFEAVNKITDDLLCGWHQNFSNRVVTDLESFIHRWNIESIVAVLTGWRLEFIGKEGIHKNLPDDSEFLKNIFGIFKYTSQLGHIPIKVAKRLNLSAWRNMVDSIDKALDQGNKIIEESINERRKISSPEIAESLLDLLIQKDNIDLDLVKRIAVDLIVAGTDTTTHSSIWALYLLSKNPQVVNLARKELRVALGDSLVVDEAVLRKTPYLRGIIKEAMRLYPVAPVLLRMVDKNCVLSGYDIPAGKMVMMSISVIGRNSEFYSNPESFCPERWLRPQHEGYCMIDSVSDESLSPCSRNNVRDDSMLQNQLGRTLPFLPFGMGVRSCIGRRIAEMEMNVLLAKCLLNFNLHLQEEVDYIIKMVGVASKPVKIKITPVESRL